jgi:uncharacterized protein YecT (DUF1311 family)
MKVTIRSPAAMLGLALGMLVVTRGAASDVPRHDRYPACLDASGGVTVAMLDCANVELNWLNGRLNGHYAEAVAALPADERLHLRDLQRAWMRYRDLDCSFLNEQGVVGTSGVLLQRSCLVEKTRARVEEMKAIAARARMIYKGEMSD